ncbi:hypothetical protein QCA50_017175 [Cerrena zonata]|uniref:transketolase n=1 Tax=Cerrena zonata TaxID=2478898 RepID=A0AAW0FQS3_9APHY
MSKDLDQLAISTIRLLSVDQVDAAQSGHPGAPLGLAPAAHAVWKRMRFNPKNTDWINRDRFILSNGHGCALLYSLLFLYGYDLSIQDLKQFRQLGSKTPGHPEAHDVPGVEVTTGPLGQGISNAVGLAIAQKQFAATYNKPDFTLSDSFVYVFLGDGCLMEGISSEASSLAGHLQLNNLIAFWDDNRISIDGDTNVAFTEDVVARYKAYGWHTIEIAHGDTDLDAVSKAVDEAKAIPDKPTLIRLTTTIGFGSLQQGTHGVHGAALKSDDVRQLKEKFGFNPDEHFAVPNEVKDYFHEHVKENQKIETEWNKTLASYVEKYPKEGKELQRRLSGKLPDGWKDALPSYKPSDKAAATLLPELIGGSADLTGSNLTKGADQAEFNLLQTVWVNSVVVTSDTVLENMFPAAYQSAIESTSTPHVIALTRQGVPHLEGSSIENASKGGYTLIKQDKPDVIIVSSGSEVSISRDAIAHLEKAGIKAGLVSLPDFHTFDKQPQSYRLSVLPDGVPILSVEVLSRFGWSKYSHEQFGLDHFGASGKAPDIYKWVEFTPEGVADRAAKTVQFYKGKPVLSPLNTAF